MRIMDSFIAKRQEDQNHRRKCQHCPLVVVFVVVVHHVTIGVRISYELHDSSTPECLPRHSLVQSPVTQQ